MTLPSGVRGVGRLKSARRGGLCLCALIAIAASGPSGTTADPRDAVRISSEPTTRVGEPATEPIDIASVDDPSVRPSGAATGTRLLLVSSFECAISGCEFENAVLRYDGLTGAYLGIHIDNIQGPYGLAIHPRTGSLLVVSRTNDEVREYDLRSGSFLGTFIAAGSTGLNAPQNILFAANGNLLVTSTPTQVKPDAVNGVLEFHGTTGDFVRVFIDGGGINPFIPENCGEERCLRGANGMDFGPNGNLYVASSINNLFLEYDGTSGALIGFFDSTKLVTPRCRNVAVVGGGFVCLLFLLIFLRLDD